MMKKDVYILGTLLWVSAFSICFIQSSIISENYHDVFKGGKRQANRCEGINCIDTPEGDCRKVDSGKGGINSCCPDYECRSSDGTISKFSGIAGAGSKGSEMTYTTPDGKGYMKSKSSSSFSQSSSSSDGPSANKNFKSHDFMNMPKPPRFDPPPHIGPPKGFFDNMPKLPHMGPPKGFFDNMPKLPKMGPSPGFFDNMPKPPQLPDW